ncbi:MAG: hypothetical protein JXR70_00280 [Spirochaetales bacterium]|nr:hypothetical protein [Spirochaetales bacterium]
MSGEREFTLPIGLEFDGKLHRKGKIRPSTAMDELETQEEDSIRFNNRLRDIVLLKRLVTRLGEISPVTEEHLENLYETDFIYLQMLCEEIDSPHSRQQATLCPRCKKEHPFDIFTLFEFEKA